MDFLNQNLIYSKTYKDLSIKGNLKNIFYSIDKTELNQDLKTM